MNWRDAPYFDLRMPEVSAAACRAGWLAAVRNREPIPQNREALRAVVTDASPVMLRNAVERIAYYFRREFRYDFVQYSATESDPTAYAFLWTNNRDSHNGLHTVVGACCFRYREYKEIPHNHALQWVWFHPYVRRHGYLSEAWPYFRQRFGAFEVEEPLSEAMGAFLKAVDRETVS